MQNDPYNNNGRSYNNYNDYEAYPFMSYDEIVAQKRRRRNRRRGLIVIFCCFTLLALFAVSFKFFRAASAFILNEADKTKTTDNLMMTSVPSVTGTGSGFEMVIGTPTDGENPQVLVTDVSDIVENVSASVVGVMSESYQNFSQNSSGSGIILSEDGYIITNNHVVSGGDNITVILADGENLHAYLIGYDEQTDLAIIKIDREGLTPAVFGDSDQLKVGEAAIVIGAPGGVAFMGSTTVGVISGLNRNMIINNTAMSLVQTDASINPGNSGGPLINKYGQVVGVTSVKISATEYEGIGFAIPINTVKPIAEELIEKGYVSGRPLVGVSVRTITRMAASFYGLPQGLYIDYVLPGSDAQRVGLRQADIITAINGEDVLSISGATAIRNTFEAGDVITVTVYRDRKLTDVEIVLSEQDNTNKDYNF